MLLYTYIELLQNTEYSILDKAYNELMDKVQTFITETPNSHDVPVKEIFTEQMFQELKDCMASIGWTGISETETLWNNDFKNRKIISGFMKDNELSLKRLVSMPDRMTNSINTDSGTLYRPTVINNFTGNLKDLSDWWSQYKSFIFETSFEKTKNGETQKIAVSSLMNLISKAKYPALTTEEEKISVPLQTLCISIFDAFLVKMVFTIAPDTWQQLRKDICVKLCSEKDKNTANILSNTYKDFDIFFLQETSVAFLQLAKENIDAYAVLSPKVLGKRDQNSVILLKKDFFCAEEYIEITDQLKFTTEDTPA